MPAGLKALTHIEIMLRMQSMVQAIAFDSASISLLARDYLRRQTSPAAMRKSGRLALSF